MTTPRSHARPSQRGSLLVATALISAALGRAQCAGQWQPGAGVPGTDAPVTAMASWDPDGSGPAPACVVAGGNFRLAGATRARGIACFDATQSNWSALGDGLSSTGAPVEVRALTVLSDGALVVAGLFTHAGGVLARNIARWDGLAWSPLGGGLDGDVRALAVMSNGDLVAGGSFLASGTTIANRLARWDGNSWTALGSPTAIGGPTVEALAVLGNGDLVVGGNFTMVDGQPANHVARWDGSQWSTLGGGTDSNVLCLVATAGGTVIAGGTFQSAGGTAAPGIAAWSGSTWASLGGGVGGVPFAHVASLAVAPTGVLIAGGNFATAGGAPARNIASWNGAAWSPVGTGVDGIVRALVAPGADDWYAGGYVNEAGGTAVGGIAHWYAGAWASTASGTNGEVTALARSGSGALVAGGAFTSIGGVPARFVAVRTTSGWAPLGSGTNAPVRAVTAAPGDAIVVGGAFTQAGSVAANRIARWDGASWSALGAGVADAAGFGGQVLAVTRMASGDLIAAGRFATAGGGAAANIARWDGTNWWPLGAGTNGDVQALAELPNGDLVVGGLFTTAGGQSAQRVARWNGTTWSPLGIGLPTPVAALSVLPDGSLIANASLWTGTAWLALGGGTVGQTLAATVLPNGHLVVAGSLSSAGGVPVANAARWDGAQWWPLGGGTDDVIFALATTGDGLRAGGRFTACDGEPSAYLGAFATNCAATTDAIGTGCAGANGLVAMAAEGYAWVGGTARTETTGLTDPSIATLLTGFGQTSLALDAILPVGGPGCWLWTTPDILSLVVPTAGVAATSFSIPPDATLAGLQFFQQLVSFELDPAGAIQLVTSSNALAWTIGTL